MQFQPAYAAALKPAMLHTHVLLKVLASPHGPTDFLGKRMNDCMSHSLSE